MKATTLSHRNPELSQAIAAMHETLDIIALNDHNRGYLVTSGKAHNYYIAQPTATQPRYNGIHAAYSRPSDTKKEIYKDWLDVISEIARMMGGDVDWATVGIASRNTFKITVCGDVVVNDTRYKLFITDSRVDIGIGVE